MSSKRISYAFSFLLVLISAGFYARAEDEKALTWMECVIIAQKIHPDILSAEEKLTQSKADKALSRSGIFPQITAGEDSSISKIEKSKSSKSHSLSVTGKQLLFDGAKTSAGVKEALENVKAAEYNKDVVSSNVRLNLRAAFVDLLRAQEFIGLTEAILALRKQNVELVSLRYEAGREHIGALLTTKANLARAEFEAAQVKRQLELGQARLNKELGEGKYRPLKVQGDFILAENLEQKPDMAKLAQENPFLKQLTAKKEAALWGISSAQADYFPQVYADASAGRNDNKFLPEKNRWAAGISFSWPLFEGGTRKAQVDKSQSVFRQSEQEFKSGKDSVIYTLEQTWANLLDARDIVLVQNKFLEAAVERSKIAQAQYSNGLITFNDWTIIEDSLVNAKKSYLDARASALLAEANWVQAKGGRLGYEE
ncbi:MAG: TolC family protein [Candidatus Omnitrophota bacterium]